MEDKKAKRKKRENRGLLAIIVYIFSVTLLLIAWALFVALYFVNVLTKISPLKRRSKGDKG